MLSFALVTLVALSSHGFQPVAPGGQQQHIMLGNNIRTASTSLRMGIFDDLRLIFSEEGRNNRAEYEARERAEMEAAQKEILERRRNPDKMADYNRQVAEGRRKLMEDRQVWDFQKKVEKDYDPIDTWKQLREEGKIKVGSDLERDESSRRLNSEGLIDVRIDERMPYIDQGYVDDTKGGDDGFAGLKNLFGGQKEED